MTMVACEACRATVPQAQSFFGTDGAVLCTRCYAMREAHTQVERGRAAAYEASAGSGLIMQAIQRSAADDRALMDHGELSAIRQPNATAASQACQGCGSVVPTADITYALDGRMLCSTCARTYDSASDRARLEGSLWRGLALGFCLSFIGVIIVHAMGRPPGEKRGAMVGAGVNAAMFLVALRLLAAGVN